MVAPPPKQKRQKRKAGEPKPPKGEKRQRAKVHDSDRCFFDWFEQMPHRLNRVHDNRMARWHKVAKKFTDAGLDYLTTSLGTTFEEETKRESVWKLSTFEHKYPIFLLFLNCIHFSSFPTTDAEQLWALQRIFYIRINDQDKYRAGGQIPPLVTYFKRNNSDEGKVFYASCEEARSQWCLLEGEIEAAKTSLLKQGYQIPLDDIEAALFFKNWLLSSASQSDLVARLNKRESGLPTMLINMRSWMDSKRKQWDLNVYQETQGDKGASYWQSTRGQYPEHSIPKLSL